MGKFIDITNKTFGYLTAIKVYDRGGCQGAIRWLCRCKCGKEFITLGRGLRDGVIDNCGCRTSEKLRNHKFHDLRGIIYNNVTFIEFSHKNKHRQSRWKCRCHCGKYFITLACCILNGHTTSCGCYRPRLSNGRGSIRHHKWKTLIRKQSNNRCNICGDTKSGLIAHHIKPWALYPELKYDPDNGVCLCRICHNKYHERYGIVGPNINVDTLQEFKQARQQQLSKI